MAETVTGVTFDAALDPVPAAPVAPVGPVGPVVPPAPQSDPVTVIAPAVPEVCRHCVPTIDPVIAGIVPVTPGRVSAPGAVVSSTVVTTELPEVFPLRVIAPVVELPFPAV